MLSVIDMHKAALVLISKGLIFHSNLYVCVCLGCLDFIVKPDTQQVKSSTEAKPNFSSPEQSQRHRSIENLEQPHLSSMVGSFSSTTLITLGIAIVYFSSPAFAEGPSLSVEDSRDIDVSG